MLDCRWPDDSTKQPQPSFPFMLLGGDPRRGIRFPEEHRGKSSFSLDPDHGQAGKGRRKNNGGKRWWLDFPLGEGQIISLWTVQL